MQDENSNLTIEQRLDLEDKINEITDNIKEIKSKKKDYFLDNSFADFNKFGYNLLET